MSEVKLQDYSSRFESVVYGRWDKEEWLLHYSIPQGSRAQNLLLAFNKTRIVYAAQSLPLACILVYAKKKKIFFLVPVPPYSVQ